MLGFAGGGGLLGLADVFYFLYLLFCLPHKRVTEKVTALDKILKKAPFR